MTRNDTHEETSEQAAGRGSGDAAPGRAKPFKTTFARAGAIVLAAVVVGQMVGNGIERFGEPSPGFAGTSLGPVTVRDLLLLAFAGSGAVLLFLTRRHVAAFFRSMHAGVALISLSVLAVAVGVLVPQIDGFEDPTERIPSVADIPEVVVESHVRAPKGDRSHVRGLTIEQIERLERYKEQYSMFRWAEGYFLYHMLHPYGLGFPEAELPAPAREGLERFGRLYGDEERSNREKQMLAAFSGQKKSAEIGEFIREHERTMRRAFDVCTALDLNRTYKSHWFATLLLLVATGVAFNTFKGKPSTWVSARKSGFVLVHLGVLTLLAGGFWSKIKTDRGLLNLFLGDAPQDTYWGYQSQDKPRRMPFALSLDRFARRDWKTVQVGFYDEDFQSRLPEYTLWPGRKIPLDIAPGKNGKPEPRIEIEVLRLSERATVEPPVFKESSGADGAETIGPLAVLDATEGDGAARTVLLKPDVGRGGANKYYYDPRWRFRLLTLHGDDLESAKRFVSNVDESAIGTLTMRLADGSAALGDTARVRIGERVQAPGGYTVEIVRAIPAFKLDPNAHSEIVDPRPLAEQEPKNPAVFVHITPPGGGEAEERPVLERLDYEDREVQKSFAFRYGELVLNFEWDRWNTPGPARYALHFDARGGARLLGADGSDAPAKIGEALRLPGDTRVVPRQLLVNAQYEKQIDFVADHVEGPHFDDDFYATDPTGAELLVSYVDTASGERKTQTVRFASTDASLANFWRSSDGRFYLYYYGNDKVFPFEWRSVLSVHEKNAAGEWTKRDLGPASKREIRVNDYFKYRGYRFFQTNADARFPNYSGIGVVYDPGIPIVLFGMYLTIFGAVIAFIVRPIVDGARKKPAQEAQA